ncbi:TonB-dependent receptor [Sphingobacterium kyonggiense]
MRAIPSIFLCVATCCSMQVFAQEHKHNDTLKNIQIEEVLVTSQVGINKRLEQEQRASKQANIDQVLDRIAGVQMIRRGNYAWEPTIRSLNAAQINLSIDGMAIFGACTDRMDPVSSYIEPSNLQQINVNLGPGFSNYGSAIGGGIDFKLANPKLTESAKLNGLLGTGYETNSQAFQTLASLQYSTARYGLLINGIFRKAQNYRAAKQAEIANSQFQKWNASAAFKYKINSKNEIQAQYLADYGQDIGYPALTMDVSFANANIASITHVYQPTVEGMDFIKSKVYFNHIDHAMDDTKRPAETVPMHMDMPGVSWTAGFYSESGKSIGKHKLQARVSAYVNRLTANMTMYPETGSPMFMFTLPDVQRGYVSLDVSDRILSSDKWAIDLLGNYSFSHSDLYSQAGKDQLSGMKEGSLTRSNHLGNAAVTTHFQANENWHLMAKVGFANRSASLQEYYGFYLFNRLDNYDYLGNVDLKTEKALQSSLGMTFKKDIWQIEANGFHYYFRDYIAGLINPDYGLMTIGASGVKQYQNLEHAALFGGEVSFRVKPLSYLELISTLAYTEGKDHDGNALPLIAPLTNNNSLLLNYKGWNAQLDLSYFAAQNKVSPAVYGDSKTPSATLLHAGIRKQFAWKQQRITSSFRVENILDRYYYRHQDIMKIARPGRNFIAQVSVSF